MSSALISINNKKVTKPYFVFDGCHKFYLVDNSDFDDVESKGYVLEEDVYPIKEIAHEFFNSCPLRFIEDWGTFENYASQGDEVTTFEIDGKVIKLDFIENKVYENEEVVCA